MKTDVEALRKKYMDNPPEGLTSCLLYTSDAADEL